MKAKKRMKRHVMGVMIHQAAWSMDRGCSILFNLLEEDAGARGFTHLIPIRGALTDRERDLIRQRKDKVRDMIADLRKIAWHLEKTGRDPE